MFETVIERWRALTREQKLSVWILTACGVFAIGFSLYHIKQSVNEPFLVNTSELATVKKIIGVTPEEEQAKQKRTDTDGDGLSDWDEVNLFHTNPNLRDTCGDGTPDNIRVLTGKNLDCGKNAQNPGASIDTSGVQSASSGIPVPAAVSPATYLPAQSAGAPSSGATAGLIDQAVPRDPKTLRESLRGRVDQARLDAMTDEQLLQMYDKALQISQQNATTTPPDDSALTTSP